MPSAETDYGAIIPRLLSEYADVFDALLEYERTKRMPKLSRKRRVDVTIDTDLLRELKRETEKRSVKLSNVVEQALRERLRTWRQG